jgi:hypothetical protein
MKLYYSDVLSPHKACAVARYLKSPVEFVYRTSARPSRPSNLGGSAISEL